MAGPFTVPAMASIVHGSSTWLSDQRRQRTAQAFRYFALFCVSAAATAALLVYTALNYTTLPRPVLAVAAVLAVGGAGFAYYCRTESGRWWGRAAAARAGQSSEDHVTRYLARDRVPGVVYNGLLIGAGGDVDHVWLSRHGIAAVETKTGKGKLTVADGALHCGGKRLKGDPLQQIARQSSALVRLTGLPATAYVVVPGATNSLMVDGIVCGPVDVLGQQMRSAPHLAAAQLHRTQALLDRALDATQRRGR